MAGDSFALQSRDEMKASARVFFQREGLLAVGRAAQNAAAWLCSGFRRARQLAAGSTGRRQHACEAVPDDSRPKKNNFQRAALSFVERKASVQNYCKTTPRYD